MAPEFTGAETHHCRGDRHVEPCLYFEGIRFATCGLVVTAVEISVECAVCGERVTLPQRVRPFVAYHMPVTSHKGGT